MGARQWALRSRSNSGGAESVSKHQKDRALPESVYERIARIVEAHTYAWENASTIYQIDEPLSFLVNDSEGRLSSISAAPRLRRAKANPAVVVDRVASKLIRLVEALVANEYVTAVLAREGWVLDALGSWPVLVWQKGDPVGEGGGGTLSFGGWPIQAKPADMIEWLETRKSWGPATHLQAILESGNFLLPWLIDGNLYSAPLVAGLYLAEQEVEAGRRKPSIAVDAGKPHHKLIQSWNAFPAKADENVTSLPAGNFKRYTLLRAGDEYQLEIDIPNTTASEAITRQLRGLLGAEGLRHWAGFLSLLSQQGNRQGWVRWTIDDHHQALGYANKRARQKDVRAKTIEMFDTFSHLELAVIDSDGDVRDRRPLVLIGSRQERRSADNKWELDGAILHVNPLLYSGVRRADGSIGQNFWPQSAEIPAINHKQYPYAIGLAFIFAQRWRIGLRSPDNCVAMSGTSLLEAAGIRQTQRHPQRTLDKLKRNLNELRKRGALGRWTVDGEPDNLKSIWRFYPPEWQSDRTHRKLAPIETWHNEIPLTGAELKKWRTERKLTQVELAKRIGMSHKTIGNAERSPEKNLGTRLANALRQANVQ
jgi:DNA-binding XRE family transcriptional regulator